MQNCSNTTEVQSIDVFQLLPPANVVCEGYVFTGVCLSTGGGGGGYPSMPCRSHDQAAVYKQVHC